ncbi:MAG: UDP-N-acetylmuramoyl-tripeptide--D-alanyl-D-alanine ligase [Cyclobacteriaceae bacterium]|nr:UDP-N-acetylmuramoyl-tripeptide--D-alanyl-D-alanine ligase [Cyclobacteriaceae bacterium]
MIAHIYKKFKASTGICTDSRAMDGGKLFFALKGPNFNANAFAQKALEQGAIAVVIDERAYEIPGKTILVGDSLSALQELARYHRQQLHIPFIGITGSNGKTTTKELMHGVLAAHYNTFATKGNLNNHIGVPLSVLSVTAAHEMAIIEMGANHIGEIAHLSSICQPDYGLITNIGKAHTGLFGGFEGVVRAKSELYDYLIKNQGTVFINQNQTILMNMSKRFANPVFYPNDGSYCPCALLEADPFVKIKTESGKHVQTQLMGSYNFDNIATALCVGKFFDVPEDKAAMAVASYTPENNRSQIITQGSNTIILDAYNANPSSMEKALENLAQMKAKNKVAIVGDMYELGDDTQTEHEAIGKLIRSLRIDVAIFCGAHMKDAWEVMNGGHYFEDKEKLMAFLTENKFHESTILIKASRGMALEGVVDFL